MIDRLLQLAVRQRALVLLLTLLFVFAGVMAARQVPIDAVPDVTDVQVKILTSAPALGASDVETYVTIPVENAMAGLPNLVEVRSLSRAGISVVTVVFRDDVDVYFARQLVNERLAEAREHIPEGYGEPRLGPVATGLGEVFHFEVRGEGYSLMELRSILEWQLNPRLRLVPGVVEVNVFGGEAQSLRLELDPARMAARGVGVGEVLEALRSNHAASGGAYLTQGDEHLTLRAEARLRTPQDLELVALPRTTGPPVYLREVGSARRAPRVRYGAVTRDGRGEAVVGVAMLLQGQNSERVVRGVRETLADVSRSLPPGVRVDAYYDRTELVHRTIHTVRNNLLEACALVVLILFLTLASLRGGLVAAAAIPLALLGAFLGMWLGGVSGNLLSLGAIDFGLLVDGAIIIVENAQHRLAEARAKRGRTLTGEERQEVVLEAAREVRGATAFGEAIIALVYLPILALEGVEGRMFRPMALTVLFALATAFVLSLTVVPALASLLLSRDVEDRPSPLVRAAHAAYAPLLRGAMRFRVGTLAFAVLLFGGTLWAASRMGREFLPRLDEGTVVVAMVQLPSVSLEHATQQTTRVEQTLRRFPEVTTVVCRTGRAEVAVDPMGVNMTDVYVLLRPREQWTTARDREGLVEAFSAALQARVPGAGFAFSQPIEMNTNDLLAGISSDLALHIYGNDLGSLRQLGDRAVRLLRGIPGAHDVRVEQIAGLDALTARVDRAAAARYGVDAREVTDTVAALGGITVGEVVEAGRRYPIEVRFGAEARRDAASLGALPVRGRDGRLVPLAQVATLESEPAPSTIGRERLQRRVTVQLNVRGRDLGSFALQARSTIDSGLRLPVGYTTAWAGEFERLQSASSRLLLVVPLALVGILVLLVASFGRVRPALLILLNVPFALTGGVGALAARGMPLSISAAVGFVALFGVAVLNGLVLLSFMEKLREEGLPLSDVVERSTRARLRAVLTTALVASLGFVPMALARGAGAEVQRPLATVVIGGLVSSTLLTLFVLPVLYALVSRPVAPPAPAEEPPSAPAA